MTNNEPEYPAASEDCHEEVNSASFNVILATQILRYSTITIWAALLSALVGLGTASIWYVATMTAGFIRSQIEKAMQKGRLKKWGGNSYHYAFVAMASCAFWAVAPYLALTSGHEFGLAAALFLIANGAMLSFSQFRTAPAEALIVTSPYMAMFGFCLISLYNTPLFFPLMATAPLFAASVTYILMFGYRFQREMDRVHEERTALVADLQKARVVAENASDAKTMFLANMSHEIRTPMNGVLGMAELLANTQLDSRQKIYADTIHKSGSALLTIINDILDFSKIEAGKLELEKAPFDLRACVEDVATLMTARAAEKNIDLVTRFQPDLPMSLIGDGGRLRQVITNLVGNGVKFTESGYVMIAVSGEICGEHVRMQIDVKDTGIGVEEAKLAKIFNAFDQADSSTTRKFGGTGLGLSISKHILEAMGGEIRVQSTPGAGSTFSIDMDFEIGLTGEVTWACDFDAAGLRALIVDDIDVNRTILTEQLQNWGFETLAVDGAKAGLRALKDAQSNGKPFDLSVLDYCMPEMDGEDLVRAIKQDEALAATKLLVLTSADVDGEAQRFRELGIDGYLVKPAREKLLFETISEMFEEYVTPVETTPKVELEHDKSIPPIPVVNNGDDAFAVMYKARLLLAEDNEVNQLVVTHMLDTDRIDLSIANNGKQALDQYKNDPGGFDLILMDVSMPEMDGHEATRAIRKYERNENKTPTPIICLTAHVLAEDVEMARQAGMDDYLAKPISKAALNNIVEKWINVKGGAADIGQCA